MNAIKYKYRVDKNVGFSPNYGYLSNIYLPLIGSNSLSLYTYLSNDLAINTSSDITFNLDKLLTSLSVSFDDFMKSRKILEAFGLMKTFFKEDEIKNKSIFTFKLFEPSTFDVFCSNNKFKKCLLNKVGIERYEELEFFYLKRKINEAEINEDYSDIFLKFDSENEFYFDFDKLATNLSKLAKTSVSLNKDTMYLIEHYFKNYNLSTNEIESSIFNSIDYSNEEFLIINDILETELSLRCEEKNKINSFNIIEIERIENFFDAEQDDVIKRKIYSIYRNTKPEDFLSSIQKHSISNIEVSIIRKLRNEFHLSNELINIIIDFSIKKTHGRLNTNYIFKVAKTINTLNCNNCKKAHDYFLSISNKNNSSHVSLETNDLNEEYVKLFN